LRLEFLGLAWNEPFGAVIVVIGAMLTQRRGSNRPAVSERMAA
jgi:hypothetical protein